MSPAALPSFRFSSLFKPQPPQQPALLSAEGFTPSSRSFLQGNAVAVARGLCRMRWLRLNQVPVAERAAALRVQAMTWQPFDDTARLLLLQEDEGLMVAWDQGHADTQLRAAGIDPARVRCLPETLLREPLPEGVHLLQGAAGFEAQCWQGQAQLRASRWWAQQPTAVELEQWLRALPSSLAAAQLPEWHEVPRWRARPWGQHVSDGGHATATGSDARLLWWAGGAFALASGLVGAQIVGAERAVSQLRADNAALRADMAPVLQQRERALSQAAEAERWAAWLQAPLPIELIQQLHETLGRLNVQLRDMELRGQTLRLGLMPPPQVPRAELLKALQTGGWFTTVTETRAENQRDLLWLELQVRGATPPSLVAEQAPPALLPATEGAPARAPTGQPEAQGKGANPPVSTAPVQVPAPAPQANAKARPAGPSQVAPKPIGPAASAGEFPPSSVFDAIK
jgi:hypothetical protein